MIHAYFEASLSQSRLGWARSDRATEPESLLPTSCLHNIRVWILAHRDAVTCQCHSGSAADSHLESLASHPDSDSDQNRHISDSDSDQNRHISVCTGTYLDHDTPCYTKPVYVRWYTGHGIAYVNTYRKTLVCRIDQMMHMQVVNTGIYQNTGIWSFQIRYMVLYCGTSRYIKVHQGIAPKPNKFRVIYGLHQYYATRSQSLSKW